MDYFVSDRDGCFTGRLGDYKNNSPSQYQGAEMPLIEEAIAMASAIKLPMLIVSNQAGIIAGYTSFDRVIAQCNWLHEQLSNKKVSIMGTLFCPDYGDTAYFVAKDGSVTKSTKLDDSADSFRKPGKGMGLLAEYYAAKNGLKKCRFYVGDLSGKPGYAPGCREPESDRLFAENMRWRYLDIEDFLSVEVRK